MINIVMPYLENLCPSFIKLSTAESNWPAVGASWSIQVIDEPCYNICHKSFLSTFHKPLCIEDMCKLTLPGRKTCIIHMK